jgi:transposase
MGMATTNVRRWITDKCWSVLGPALAGAKRSKAGKPSRQSDRELVEALIWESRTGSPWRDMPVEFGRWHNAYMRFRRWEKAGVWRRFWEALHGDALSEALVIFMDSTTVRAHQHASGAPGKTAEESCLGRSRGGLTTKIHVASLNESQAAVIQLTPGQASDCAQFESLYRALPEENLLESAALDKGYDTNAIRDRLSLDGIEPVIPPRSHRLAPIGYDKIKYKERNRAERFFNKLKHFRRIATRYEKHAFTFLAMVHIVAAFISARN